MDAATPTTHTAFAGTRRLASGDLRVVALAVKRLLDRPKPAAHDRAILIFNNATGQVVDLDFRGSPDEVVSRLAAASDVDSPAAEQDPQQQQQQQQARGPGRPKLGVVAREVTLLPRHWEWLNAQPGGASVALRRLVEDARRAYSERDKVRLAQEAAYRFMRTMAGDSPGYEEALRALFAGQRDQFLACIADWPADIAEHSRALASAAFS